MRVGIILNKTMIPAWAAEVIQEVNRFNDVQWAIVIRVDTNPRPDSKSFNYFKKIDSLILSEKPNLFLNVDYKFPEAVPEIKVKLVKSGRHYSIAPVDLNLVRDSNPDLILHFGLESLNGQILELPKLGVWCLRYGDQNQLTSPPVGFWEWFHRDQVTRVNLIRMTNSEVGFECLAVATTRTEQLSFGRNQRACFSMGIDLLSTMVSKAANTGTLPRGAQFDQSPSRHTTGEPHFQDAMIAILKLIGRLISKAITKTVFIEQWVLFYSFIPQDFPQLDFQKFKALVPPKDRIWADPFVISMNGKHYLFIEELLLKTNKGHISCLVMNESGQIEDSRILIDKPYHLSYPFIFQHEHIWYMIPESAESRTVDLFECIEFPFQWKFKRSLLTDIEAFDSTLHFQDGQFWLFCTIRKSRGASSDDNLYLFYTNDLLEGKWHPHYNNPVISNPKSARPAGRIISHKGSLYRPSQICIPRYGYGLALNKILKLTESAYVEETVTTALPAWRKDVLSVHTYNSSEYITLIDGQLKRSKL